MCSNFNTGALFLPDSQTKWYITTCIMDNEAHDYGRYNISNSSASSDIFEPTSLNDGKLFVLPKCLSRQTSKEVRCQVQALASPSLLSHFFIGLNARNNNVFTFLCLYCTIISCYGNVI